MLGCCAQKIHAGRCNRPALIAHGFQIDAGCARAASGHVAVAAAPPSIAMNSRRFIFAVIR
jgi:hypothetical protein